MKTPLLFFGLCYPYNAIEINGLTYSSHYFLNIAYRNNDLAEEKEEEFFLEAEGVNIHGNDPNTMNNIRPEIVLSEKIYDFQIKNTIFLSLLSLKKYNKDQIRELIGVDENFQEFTFLSKKMTTESWKLSCK